MISQKRGLTAAAIVLSLMMTVISVAAPVVAQEPQAPPSSNGIAEPGTAAVSPSAAAPAAPKIDPGDTAWVLVSTALVLAMTAPGLALFYGGMVREKNVLGTIMQSFIILCVISLQWVLWGYSLSFGPYHGHVIGGLEWLGLQDVRSDVPNSDYAATIPHQAFMIFQMMFAWCGIVAA